METQEKVDLLQKLLKEGAVELRFEKVDGSIREMRCTLKEDLLPKQDTNKIVVEKKQSDLTMQVFDLEKKEFRSFRKDKLLDFKVFILTPEEIKNDIINL